MRNSPCIPLVLAAAGTFLHLGTLTAPIVAQTPTPRVAPRAAWSLTPGVTGTPSQRRDNPGAASNDKMYVFGGRDGNAGTATRNALYEFDGAAWTLRTAEGAAGSPPTRGGACVAWDFTRDKLIVFGGDTGGATPVLLGDTWEWDPTTNAWTDVTPTSGNPAPRRFSAMTWDPITGGMLMFGGDTSISPITCTNDTWLFVGGAWVQLSTGTTPPIRRQHSMVTRPEMLDIVMIVGIDSSVSPNVPRTDVWRWNGADWAQIATNGTIPHSANANQGVYDQVRRRIVLQGGQGLGTLDAVNYPLYTGSPSTWCSEFDSLTNEWRLYGAPGSNWNTTATASNRDPVIGAISRYFAAYVPALQKVYKVSGQNPSGLGTITATCEYQANPIANSDTLGGPCVGAGGPLMFNTVSEPWTGRTFQLDASGIAANSLAFAVFGFGSVTTPLSALHPAGQPGCLLRTTPDVVFFLAPVGGNASVGITLPDNPALANSQLFGQVLQVELDAQFNITAVVGSNGVIMIVGAL